MRAAWLGIVVGLGLGADAWGAEVVKVGTLWPKSSPVGKGLETWAAAVASKSGGAVEVRVSYNGVMGDEAAMIGKLKRGELDAALVSGVGLGNVYKPILALQMPGLFPSWLKLDAARDAMKSDFDKGVADAGFTNLGWVDVGVTRLFSKGADVRTPSALESRKMHVWRDDTLAVTLAQVVGYTGVPLTVPEVLPALNTGAVDTLSASASFAEALQWTAKVDRVGADPIAYQVGALVMSSKRLGAIPSDQRAIVVDTAKVATAGLQKRVRLEDDAAYGRIVAKMTPITWTVDEKALWTSTFAATRTRLAQGTFSADLVTKLEALAK